MACDEDVERERWRRGHEVAILAMIELIPGIGGAAATIADGVFERRRTQQRERVAEFGSQVLGEVSPEDLLEQLRSDDRFGDLFVEAVQRVAVAGWDNKRRAMGRVVAQALRGDDAHLDESERLLAALHELDAGDFAALARLKVLHARQGDTGNPPAVESVEGLAGSIGPLLRHRALAQMSVYGGIAYLPTAFGERLLALVATD